MSCAVHFKAIDELRRALRGDGTHIFSLGKVFRILRDTGAEMKTNTWKPFAVAWL
ncbi:MAG: hypothetical protein HKN42_00675 [Granulosicoccus sp.]|nr:hypothetical protein [Granulosicoccus sp.]